MTKPAQKNFYLNESSSLQPKQALSFYYIVKIFPKLWEKNDLYLYLSLEFFSRFLKEMHPDVFSVLPSDSIVPALTFIREGDKERLFKYVKETCVFMFESPELFFDNISALKERIIESWFFPLKHHGVHMDAFTVNIQNALIGHYKYKYLLFPLDFGNLNKK